MYVMHKHLRAVPGRCTFVIALIVAAAARAESPATTRSAESRSPRFVSIEPTALLAREDDALAQEVHILVDNPGEPVEVSIDAVFGSQERSANLGTAKTGQSVFSMLVPDIREPMPVEFVLKAGGKGTDRRQVTWTPQRRWEVYWIPIDHHDLGYTQPIEDVLRHHDGYYDDVLRLCEETDEWPEESRYRYTVEAAWSIQHFVENRPPEVVEKLTRYLKAGRIEVHALLGNEISNLCGHEELIRLAYPSFRMKRQLGAPIRTASITDIPGLSWGLPTVLADAGVRYFFAGLPTYFEWYDIKTHTFWDESAVLRYGRPDAFRWQGPDGASVLVYYQGGYGCWLPDSYDTAMKDLPPALADMEKRGSPFSVMRFGAHGCGDNAPPDLVVSRIAREWNRSWAWPKLIVATSSQFFEALEKQCQDVRTFRGELPDTDYVVGATSTVRETALNRGTHDRLAAAEKFNTIASVLNRFPPATEPIRQAWDNAVLYDEHTWGMWYIAGRAQDWNWSDKSHYAYKAAGLADSVLSRSLAQGIVDAIERKEDTPYIVVFNPLSFVRTDVVRTMPKWEGKIDFVLDGRFDLIDDQTGRKVPWQIVKLDDPQAPAPEAAHRYALAHIGHGAPGDPTPYRKELVELVFVASDVPSMGYKTYRLAPKETATAPSSEIVVGDDRLENRFYKIVLDPQTGTIRSLFDKELSRELVDAEAPHRFNQFIARSALTGQLESPAKAVIRRGHGGPVCASLRVDAEGGGCVRLMQEIALYDQLKRVDLASRVLKDSTALVEYYFAFPFKADNPEFRFEGSNSVIRPMRDQFPGSNTNYYAVQHWAHVWDGKVGITLSPVESHLLEFGGLWPSYVSQAHHGATPPDFGREFVKPAEVTKGHMYSYVLNSNFRTNFQPLQQGDFLFRYSITAHEGDWKEGRARNFGWAVGNPLVPVCVSGKKEGPLGRTLSFCQVDKPNVLVLALKRAEDGDGIILRLIETEGEAVTATVTLPHLTIREAHRTNVVEENQEALDAGSHKIKVPVKAFGITTVRLRE